MQAIRSVLPEVEDQAATPYHMTLGQCGNRASAAELEHSLQHQEWTWPVSSVALLSQKGKGKFATLEVLPLAERAGEGPADGSCDAPGPGTSKGAGE